MKKVPNLNPLLGASRSVASALKKFVVYESTVYPGCTEEEANFGKHFRIKRRGVDLIWL
jgi:UDP-N-acetyl-D-mannosaminuronate dehydrogenase